MEGSMTEGHVVGIPVSSRAYGIEEPEFPEEQTPDHGEFPSSFQSSYGESRTPALYLFDFGSLQPRRGRNQEERVLTKLLLPFRCEQLHDRRPADEQTRQEGRQDRSGHQRTR
jgi:hypothetical protein